MKKLSKKASFIFFCWLVCTGILVFAYLGLIRFPSEYVAGAYLIAWLVITNCALVLSIKSSSLATGILTIGWLGGFVHCYLQGELYATEYAVTFALLIISTFLATDYSGVWIPRIFSVVNIKQENRIETVKVWGEEFDVKGKSTVDSALDMPSYQNLGMLSNSSTKATSYRNIGSVHSNSVPGDNN